MVLRVNVDDEDGVSVETLLDCSAAEFLQQHRSDTGKYIFSIPPSSKPRQSLNNLLISNEARWRDHLIRQYENGTIQVWIADEVQQMAKPLLRDIASEIGVNLLNSNSQPKNTRQLGADIIKVLQVKASRG